MIDRLHNTMLLLLIKFPDIVEFSEEMASLGKIVIVAALDGTFQRKVVMILLDCWLHVFRCSVYTEPCCCTKIWTPSCSKIGMLKSRSNFKLV